jgi:toxin-antitoxin system PIN domain toxin
VIAVDTNILVYAHRHDSPHFARASSQLRALAQSPLAWAIPWPCLHEFLAVVTHPRIHKPPTPIAEALEQVEIWRESPSLVLLAESDRHWRDLRAFMIAGHITGPRVHDARIAALCRQHGVRELWSADRDFSRFAGLKVVNPLLG